MVWRTYCRAMSVSEITMILKNRKALELIVLRSIPKKFLKKKWNVDTMITPFPAKKRRSSFG